MWQSREPTKKERLAQLIGRYWLIVVLLVAIAAALFVALYDPPRLNPALSFTARQIGRTGE